MDVSGTVFNGATNFRRKEVVSEKQKQQQQQQPPRGSHRFDLSCSRHLRKQLRTVARGAGLAPRRPLGVAASSTAPLEKSRMLQRRASDGTDESANVGS